MEEKKDFLSKNYLNEVLAAMLQQANKDFSRTVSTYMQYEYLPSEQYKNIFRLIRTVLSTTGSNPSFGVVTEYFKDDLKTLAILEKIQRSERVDVNVLLSQYESFIKRRAFASKLVTITNTYNEGKHEQAYKDFNELNTFISNLSFSGDGCVKVLAGAVERNTQRKIKHEEDSRKGYMKRMPSHIDGMDALLRGGFERGQTYLGMAGSGKYKSTFLRWIGVTATTRSNLNVLHLQAEDTEEATLETYDCAIFGQTLNDIEIGNVSDKAIAETFEKLKATEMPFGELYLKAFEKFNKPKTSSCVNLIKDVERKHNIKIDIVLWDYLELFEPDSKYTDERSRRECIANEIKNISMECEVASIAVTQAMDVSETVLNVPNFVLTRNHISEFKGLIKPFSVFFTFNQTEDEYKDNIMRLYFDKMRKGCKAKQIVQIFIAPEFGKFYDKKKTLDYAAAGKQQQH